MRRFKRLEVEWEQVAKYTKQHIGYCLPSAWTLSVEGHEAGDLWGGWIFLDEVRVIPESKKVEFSGTYVAMGYGYRVEGFWDSQGYWEFHRKEVEA